MKDPDVETILVVEDEQAVRWVVRRVLEREGYRVLEAATPREALRLAAQAGEGFSLVLSDVVLPDLTGAELGRALRSIRPGVSILFMSGYAIEDVAARLKGVESAGIVSKPFTPRSLVTAVKQALQPVEI